MGVSFRLDVTHGEGDRLDYITAMQNGRLCLTRAELNHTITI